MKVRHLMPILLLTAGATLVQAQVDVTAPGDLITLVNGVNDGDGFAGAPPNGEGVTNAIDNTMSTKYLNFLDLNSGFMVTPSMGATVVTGLRLWTANDAPERDPLTFLLEGSNDGGANFFVIATGLTGLTTDPGRNTVGPAVSFTNVLSFTTYRLTFPTLRDAATANSMQIAEAELLGSPVPEPATLLVLGSAVAGLAARRRARRG